MPPPNAPLSPAACQPSAASTKYNTVQEFLEGAANVGALDDLLIYHEGNFCLADGRQFQIKKVESNNIEKLTVVRRYGADTSLAQRTLDRVVDALWPRSDRNRLRTCVNATLTGMVPLVKSDMRNVALPTIKKYLLGDGAPTLEASVESVDVKTGPESILPWLSNEAPSNPIRRDNVIDTTLQGNTLLARFRHEQGILVLRFVRTGDEYSRETGTSLGQRDLERLHRLLEAKQSRWDDVPPYASARQLMTQFVRMRVEDEAPDLLRKYAQGKQVLALGDKGFPPCEGLRYPLLSRNPARHGVLADYAGDGARVVERAVRECVGECSRELAGHFGIDPGLMRSPNVTAVDKFTNRALDAVQRAATEALDGHDLKSFRTRLLDQITVDEQTARDIKGIRHDGYTAPGKLGARKVVEKKRDSRQPSVAVLQMQTKLGFLESVPYHLGWGRSRGLQGAAGEPRSKVVVDGVKVIKAVDLYVGTNPEMLRFPLPPANPRKAAEWGADFAAARPAKYKSLNALLDAWYLTVYDNHMHEDVLPKVEAAIDASVTAMRQEAEQDLSMRVSRQLDEAAVEWRGHNVQEGVAMRNVRQAVLSLELARLRWKSARAASQDAEGRLSAWSGVETGANAGYVRAHATALTALTDATLAQAAARSAYDAVLPMLTQAIREVGFNEEDVPKIRQELEAEYVLENWGDVRSPSGRIASEVNAIRIAVARHQQRMESMERTLRDRMQNLRIGNTTVSELRRWRAAEIDYGLAVQEHKQNEAAQRMQDRPPAAMESDAQQAVEQHAEIQPDPQPEGPLAGVGAELPQGTVVAAGSASDSTVFDSVEQGAASLLWSALNPFGSRPSTPRILDGDAYALGARGVRPMSLPIRQPAPGELPRSQSDGVVVAPSLFAGR